MDGVSFSVAPGKLLGIVGESGSGKSASVLSIMRLLPESARIVSGEVIFEDQDLLKLSEPEMRHVRGARIAMIFQEPMTSLNPVFTIGSQIGEAVRLHQQTNRARDPQSHDRGAADGRDCRPRASYRRLSASVVGRDAPARDDRDGAVVQPAPADRGRADDGARRDDTGADSRSDSRAAGAARPRSDTGHARSRNRRRVCRRRDDSLRGARDGTGADRGAVSKSAQSVHARIARIDSRHRRHPAPSLAGDSRLDSELAESAGGMQISSAMPARYSSMLRGRAAARKQRPPTTMSPASAPNPDRCRPRPRRRRAAGSRRESQQGVSGGIDGHHRRDKAFGKSGGRRQSGDSTGRDGGIGRRVGIGQIDAGAADSETARADRRRRLFRRPRSLDAWPRGTAHAAAADAAGVSGSLRVVESADARAIDRRRGNRDSQTRARQGKGRSDRRAARDGRDERRRDGSLCRTNSRAGSASESESRGRSR